MDPQFELGAPVGAKPLRPPTEAGAGRVNYLDFLAYLHEALKPRLYLEIGVRLGKSLTLARGEAIGVDPDFSVNFELAAPTRLFKLPSDEFFSTRAPDVLKRPIDLAFVDGMHWFEYALRDFINIERYATPATVVVFDDVLPNHPLQAHRDRQTGFWTGDVWKLVPCLRRYRPDLTVVELDTRPTGLLLVLGLSPSNRELSDRYDEIIRVFNSEIGVSPDNDILGRVRAVDPECPALRSAIEGIPAARGQDDAAVRDGVRKLTGALPALAPDEPIEAVSIADISRDRINGMAQVARNQRPALSRAREAIYLPPGQLPDGGFGLFRSDGKAVPESIYLRGAAERPFRQPDSIELPDPASLDRVDGPSYFIGPLVSHFGYFLTEIVSRLWAVSNEGEPPPRLLYHYPDASDVWTRFPHVRLLLGALGLDKGSLRRVDRPTLLADVTAAEGAIQARRKVYADEMILYEKIAARLLRGWDRQRDSRPAYFSKSRLNRGVSKIINEFEVEAELEREGVRIVHPQEMGLIEQVRLVNAHDRLCGSVGSALHIALLALDRKRIVYLVPTPRVNTTYVNIDRARGHRSCFVFSAGVNAHHGSFAGSFRIKQPRRVAETLLRELES